MTYDVMTILVTPVFTLAGVIFSTIWSSLRHEKEVAKEMERYKGIVMEKLHNSSNRFDNAIEMYKKLNIACAVVYEDMCCIFPSRLRKYILREHTTELFKVCADVGKLEIEINVNEPFVNRNVLTGYKSLLFTANEEK